MRNIFLLLSLILVGYNNVIARNTDTIRINALIDSSQAVIYDSIKAHYLADQAISYARKISQRNKLGEALINKGRIYRHFLQYSKAIGYYDQAISVYKISGNEEKLAELFRTSGRYYYETGNYKKAMERYVKGLDICEKHGLENSTKAWLLRYIGSVFKREGNQDKAIEYYKSALKAFKTLNEPDGMASCLNNIGNVYGILENDSLQLVYYNKALKITEENDLKWRASIILDNLAAIYSDRNDYETALVYLNRSFGYLIQSDRPDYTSLSVNYRYRANLFFLEKDYAEALSLLKEAERLISKTEKKQKLELLDIYSLYSDIYAAIGDYEKAYNYYMKFDKIDDSLTNIATAVEVEKTHLQFQIEQTRRQEEAKKKMEDVKYAGQQRTITILIIGAVILLFVSIIIFRQKKKLSVANSDLAESLEKEKELGYLKSRFVSTASHQFRTPLTVIKASMSLMDMHINTVNVETQPAIVKLKERVTEQVDNMTTLMNQVLMLSKINSGSVKANFEETDIVKLCEDICNDISVIQEDGRRAMFYTEINAEIISIDPNLARQAISNLLSNAFKYSQGKPAPHFKIQNCNDFLIISILDYGIGIPKDDLNHLFQPFFRASNTSGILGTGLGISVAKEYVEMMGGELSVSSVKDQGSEFTIRFEKAA